MSNYPFPNQPLWLRPIQMVYLWGYNLYHKIWNKIRGYDGTNSIILFKSLAFKEVEEIEKAEIISIFVKSFNKDKKLSKKYGKIVKVKPNKNKVSS